MMTILVFGASGFLGRQVCDYLISQNHHVVGVTRKRTERHRSNVRWLETDYSSLSLASAVKSVNSPEAAIILSSQRPGVSSGGRAFAISDYVQNIEIFSSILEACIKNNISSITFSSTISVYSQTELPRLENDQDIPISLYGESKRALESLCLFYQKNIGINIKSLRLAQILGWGDRPGSLLGTWLGRAVKGLPLELTSSGDCLRQYLYIKDAARAMADFLKPTIPSGIYNIGIPGLVSHRELGQAIAKVFSTTLNENAFEPTVFSRREGVEMDVSRARSVGWSPQYTMESSLSDLLVSVNG